MNNLALAFLKRMEVLFRISLIVSILFAALSGCMEGEEINTPIGSKPDLQSALDAFQQACLQTDSNFPNWRAIMSSNGLSEAGRLKSQLPASYPSGDVIAYKGKFKSQTKNGANRDCNVLIEGDRLAEANAVLKNSLRNNPWRNREESQIYYIPSNREKSTFSKSFVLPSKEIALVYARTTTIGNAGVLTALNVTIYPASRF